MCGVPLTYGGGLLETVGVMSTALLCKPSQSLVMPHRGSSLLDMALTKAYLQMYTCVKSMDFLSLLHD